MPRKIQPGNFFFIFKQLFVFKLFHFRGIKLLRHGKGGICVKKAYLPCNIFTLVVIKLRNYRRQNADHLMPVKPESVKSAAFDKAFNRTFIEILAVNAPAKVVKAFIR